MIVYTETARGRSLVARAVALLVTGLFILHALAHLVGLKDIWGIGGAAVNTTTYLTGLGAHTAAYAALGGAWLAASVLFVAAAAGIALRRSWWLPVAFAAAFVSLALCVIWSEAAIVGLVLNVLILVGLVVVASAGLVRRKRVS